MSNKLQILRSSTVKSDYDSALDSINSRTPVDGEISICKYTDEKGALNGILNVCVVSEDASTHSFIKINPNRNDKIKVSDPIGEGLLSLSADFATYDIVLMSSSPTTATTNTFSDINVTSPLMAENGDALFKTLIIKNNGTSVMTITDASKIGSQVSISIGAGQKIEANIIYYKINGTVSSEIDYILK